MLNRPATWLQAGLAGTLIALAAAAWWHASPDDDTATHERAARNLGLRLGERLGAEDLHDWQSVVACADAWAARQGCPIRLDCRSEAGDHRLIERAGENRPQPLESKAHTELTVMRAGRALGVVKLHVLAESSESARPGARFWIVAIVSTWVALTVTAIAIRVRRTPARDRFGAAWSQERARVAQTLDFLTTAVVVIDSHGAIVFANRAMCGLIGRAEDEIRGSALDALPWAGESEHSQRVSEAGPPDWRRVLECPGEPLSQRVAMVDPRGETRSLDAACTVITQRGRVLGLLLTLDDVTALTRQGAELERARRAADHANHAKSAFLANMSHDIRTPIHGVIGALDLLEGTDLSAGQRTFIDAAACSATALLHLINDILDFSKIEAGKLDLCTRAFDLEQCVASAFKVAAAARGDKQIELVLDIAPLVNRRVHGDPDRLRQVVINLVSNAIKFTSRGEVRVRARLEEKPDGRLGVTIGVADSGIGIPADRVDRLFKPFSQVDISTTREYGGTGLGLAICKQLLELMGGGVSVSSTPGVGSVFTATLLLPARGDEADDAAPADARVRRTSVSRCVYLESNTATRQALEDVMAMHGIEPEHHGSLESLLEGLRTRGHDGRTVVMVRVDAWNERTHAMLRSVRAVVHGARCVALCMDAPSGGDASAAEQMVDAWLVKPLSPTELLDALTSAPGESRASETTSRFVLDPAVAETKQVLVAEDHPVSQMIARNYLESLGIRHQIAETGDIAVRMATTTTFDAVFMDCHLPGVDGYGAAEAIRAWEAANGRPRTPIIALTAGAMQGDRERCLRAGMDGFLTKPLRRSELAAALSSVLGVRLVAPIAGADAGPDLPVAAEPVFDPEALAARCLGNPELAKRLLAFFEERTRSDLRELAKALLEAEIAQVRAHAHSIAGGAAQVGATTVLDRARQIEQAEDATLESLAGMAEALSDEVSRYIHGAAAWSAKGAVERSFSG